MTDKINIFGIANSYPYLKRIDNRQLKEGDCLMFKEKINWIHGLSMQEIEIILEYHKACSMDRL